MDSGDVRCDEQELVGYLKSTDKQFRFPMLGSSAREGVRVTRNRERQDADRRPLHKLGWRDELEASQAERGRRQSRTTRFRALTIVCYQANEGDRST